MIAQDRMAIPQQVLLVRKVQQFADRKFGAGGASLREVGDRVHKLLRVELESHSLRHATAHRTGVLCSESTVLPPARQQHQGRYQQDQDQPRATLSPERARRVR